MCERFFENFKNLICNAKWRKTISGTEARKTLNFRPRTYNVPSGSRPKYLKTRPKAEFNGTDGTGGTGRTVTKSVL